MTRRRIYTEGENGEQIDITPLPRHVKILRLWPRMLRYRIRNNRRVVLALAKLRRLRSVR